MKRFNPALIIIANLALFLPVTGRGFVTDDFIHLYSVAYEPVKAGLLQATGGTFYSPTAWLSYSLDWTLWGWAPFPFSLVNLLLHSANLLLVYALARTLWRSARAGWWAALGYALLYPANVSIVMFVGARAHLFSVFFFLAALLSALWFARSDRRQTCAAVATVAFATLAMFSKESGVTTPAAVILLLLYERLTAGRIRRPQAANAVLLAGFCLSLAAYAIVRSRSGAVAIGFGCDRFQYCVSPRVLTEHLVAYAWRTYGLTAILAMALGLSQGLRGYRAGFGSITRNEIGLSLALFACTLAPFLPIASKSDLYSYLPGIAPVLLLGAMTRSLHGAVSQRPVRFARAALIPPLLVITTYVAFSVNRSLQWMRMAEMSTIVLNQIAAQVVKPEPHTYFLMRRDVARIGPDDPIHWGFGYALSVLYADETLEGLIVHEGELCAECDQPSHARVVHLTLTRDGRGKPLVIPETAQSIER